jgi:hypothetical protein
MENMDLAHALPSDGKSHDWNKIIEEWRESGKSIAEWVREREDITYQQFMKQRRKLFPEDIRKNEFVEEETTWSAIKMEIPSSTIDVLINDCQIVVRTGFDQELLREVVEVLKNAH